MRFCSGKNIWLSWYTTVPSNQYEFTSSSSFSHFHSDHKFHAELKSFPSEIKKTIYSCNFFQIFILKWKKMLLAKIYRPLFSDISAANDRCLITHSISIRSGALYFLIVLVLPSSGLFMAPLQLRQLQRSRRWSSDKAYPGSPFYRLFSNPKVSRAR